MKNQFRFLTLLLAVGCYNIGCNHSATENAVVARPPKTIILAIDGGGIKGVMPAFILDSIEEITGKQGYQLFDIIGGTSTGGIISTALTSQNISTTKPYSANYIFNFYLKFGPAIFVPQPTDSTFGADYYANLNDTTGIEPLLQKMLGDTTSLSGNHGYIKALNACRVKQMFTTCYIINSKGNVVNDPAKGTDYGPYLFNWYDADRAAGDNYYMWEAARGTSAALTYFPIAHPGNPNNPKPGTGLEKWVVDGGVMSNNPAVWAISEALRTGIAKRLEDIVVISIGTGIYAGQAGAGINNNYSFTVPANGNWGKVPWITDSMYDLEGVEQDPGLVLDIFSYAVQLVPNKQLQGMQKAGLQYYRLEPAITNTQTAMDNISPANIKSLVDTVRSYISYGTGGTAFRQIIDSLKANVW